MDCVVYLKSGWICFDVGGLHLERAVAINLIRIRSIKSYSKKLTEVRLVLEYLDGTVEVESFSLREELRMLNYPNYVSLCNSVERFVLR